MRTTKRFTPAVLERFRREGRSVGTYGDYRPWHRVGRGDPASHGRSHLVPWKFRLLELLSDEEWVACSFALMVQELEDLREQFALSLEAGPHELLAYDCRLEAKTLPGTLELARQLGMKHPMVYDEGHSAPWVMTTDLLLTLRRPTGQLELLAVACKSDMDLATPRTIEKLRLESCYWQCRKVHWLLLTPKQYDESVGLMLRNSIGYVTHDRLPDPSRRAACAVAKAASGRSLTTAFDQLADRLGSLHLAQCAFWQAVWSGELPLDLRRSWRTHEPIALLEAEAFRALNPIASRRTAWNR